MREVANQVDDLKETNSRLFIQYTSLNSIIVFPIESRERVARIRDIVAECMRHFPFLLNYSFISLPQD
jgi:hypothetical protein